MKKGLIRYGEQHEEGRNTGQPKTFVLTGNREADLVRVDIDSGFSEAERRHLKEMISRSDYPTVAGRMFVNLRLGWLLLACLLAIVAIGLFSLRSLAPASLALISLWLALQPYRLHRAQRDSA